jgi:hypothetical protein
LLFRAMACIVFHSDCCLSIVSGGDCILVMWYPTKTRNIT